MEESKVIVNGVKSLSDEQVHEICSRLQAGEGPKYLADSMGIGYPIVKMIKAGKSYTSISSQYTFPEAKSHPEKLSDDIIHEVCRRLQDGASQSEIYKSMNISPEVVRRVAKRRGYCNISKDYNF